MQLLSEEIKPIAYSSIDIRKVYRFELEEIA
jgi:hypothetical protein